MPAETRALLRELARCPGIHLAIISGRALSDVKMHVGIEGAFYAGNHGLEMSGPGLNLHSPQAARVHGDLEKAVAFLVEKTAVLEGVLVEPKGATAAIHWRLASEESRRTLAGLMQAVVMNFPRLRLTTGKCVWELRPREGWNKGDALAHLANRAGVSTRDTIYLGDDVTDEDAFRAADGGLTFHVGPPGEETAAQYRTRDPDDVREFLCAILGLRTGVIAMDAEELPEYSNIVNLADAVASVG